MHHILARSVRRPAVLAGALVALVFGCLVLPNVTRAQSCPAGWIPGTITISMNLSCPTAVNPVNVTAHICFPDPNGTVNPKTQYILQWIEYDQTTINCDMSAAEMRRLGDSIVRNNPGNFICNAICNSWCEQHPFCPCASLCPEWSISWASCWKPILGGPTFRPCDGYGYCQDQYNVCREIVSISPSGDTTFRKKTYLAGALGGTYCEGNAALDPLCKLVCPDPLPPRGPGDTCDAAARPPEKEEISHRHDGSGVNGAAGVPKGEVRTSSGAVALRPRD